MKRFYSALAILAACVLPGTAHADFGGDIDSDLNFSTTQYVTDDTRIPGTTASGAVTVSITDATVINEGYQITIYDQGTLSFSGELAQYQDTGTSQMHIQGGTVLFSNKARDTSVVGANMDAGLLLFSSGAEYAGSGNLNVNGGQVNFTNAVYSGSGELIVGGGAVTFSGAGSGHTGPGSVTVNSGAVTFGSGSKIEHLTAGQNVSVSGGSLTFEAGSTYGRNSGIKASGGTLNVDTGMAGGFATAFGATMLSDAVLNVTGSGGYAGDLALGAGSTGNQVNILSGGTFGGMDVKQANLNIKSNTVFQGAVQGNAITADTGNIEFQNSVTADELDVKNGRTVTFTGAAADFAGGTVNNDGTLSFSDGAKYSSSGDVNNSGTLNADASMTGMGTLAGKTKLASNSVVNLTDKYGGSLFEDLDFSGSGADNTVAINMGSPGKTSTFGDLNAGAAGLHVLGNAALTAGKTVQSTSSLTVESGGMLLFSGPGANTAFVKAPEMTVKGGVNIGDTGTLSVDGNVIFAGGSSLKVNADSSGISKLVTTNGGNITIAGSTDIRFTGKTEDILDKKFLIADGIFTGLENLQNPLYHFFLDHSGAYVHVDSRHDTIDVMGDSFGYDRISINKYHGGKYIDGLIARGGYAHEIALDHYIQDAAGLSADRAQEAFGQLFGEYGAYANQGILDAAYRYGTALESRLDQAQSARLAQLGQAGMAAEEQAAKGAGSNVWASSFGGWGKERNRDYLSGYDSKSAGIMGGYELQAERAEAGLVAGYSQGETKVHKLSTTIDSDVLLLGLYGQYTDDSGFFARTKTSFAYGWNEYDVSLVLGGKKSGKYENWAYSAGADLGYILPLGEDFSLIPSVGAEYVHARNESWTENVSGSELPGNRFDSSSTEFVRFPAIVRLNKDFFLPDGGHIAPEVRVGWVGQSKKNIKTIHAGLIDDGYSATMETEHASRDRFVLGGGVKAEADILELRLDYSFESASHFRSHDFSLLVGMDF